MQEIERISATVPKEIKDEMEQIAKERHTSVSGLVAGSIPARGSLVFGTHVGRGCEICQSIR